VPPASPALRQELLSTRQLLRMDPYTPPPLLAETLPTTTQLVSAEIPPDAPPPNRPAVLFESRQLLRRQDSAPPPEPDEVFQAITQLLTVPRLMPPPYEAELLSTRQVATTSLEKEPQQTPPPRPVEFFPLLTVNPDNIAPLVR